MSGVDHERFDRAVEGAGAKFAGRVITPSLLGAVLVLGGVAVNSITGSIAAVASSQAEQGKKIEEMQNAAGDVRTAVSVMNTKLDEAVIRRLNDLEKRVEALERSDRTR